MEGQEPALTEMLGTAIAGLALLVSLFSAWSTRRFARKQFEHLQPQFAASQQPDVEIRIFNQRTRPGTQDFGTALFMEATNYSRTVTVNNLRVHVSFEDFGDMTGGSFLFPPTGDLKTGEMVKLQSLNDFDLMIRKMFGDPAIEAAVVLDEGDTVWVDMANVAAYPGTARHKFTPRYTGASPVDVEKQVYLHVVRGG